MQHLVKNPKYQKVWGTSYANELGQLAQRMLGRVEGTNTIMFINKEDTPTALCRYVAYGRLVVSYRQENNYANRTRLTVGGDRVHYPGYCGTPTVALLTVKLILDIMLKNLGARYMNLHIKDFISIRH